MNYTHIFFYTFLFILMVYHHLESNLIRERFEDVCIDEDNVIRQLEPKPKPKNPKEVYYINSKFNYLEAQEICKSYNGTLATLKQLEDAHTNGANWCKWGWLSNETIGYPVQEKYWMDMEKHHKGHCGPTAGINKLYNVDPLQKYGVNCYGIKPKKTKKDTKLTDSVNDTKSLDLQIKQCKAIKATKQKVNKQKWIKKKKRDIRILGFNETTWSNSVPAKKTKITKSWF